jgi:hypothetical protein
MCELASGPNLQRDFPGKDRKKAKVKKPATAALPKPRTIKFHEYKVCVVNSVTEPIIFLPGSKEPQILISAQAPALALAPAPVPDLDSFIRYLENYLF